MKVSKIGNSGKVAKAGIQYMYPTTFTTTSTGVHPSSSVASLLSARRPSWSPLLPLDLPRRRRVNNDMELTAQAHSVSYSSPAADDGGNFCRSLQIDMKSLVGDAVGNVSSPISTSGSSDWDLVQILMVMTDEYKPSKSRRGTRCVCDVLPWLLPLPDDTLKEAWPVYHRFGSSVRSSSFSSSRGHFQCW